MKKLIITSLIVGSIACAAFASTVDYSFMSSNWSHYSGWDDKADWDKGQNRFIEQLNLEPERAAKMAEILSSYREIPKLYFTNQTDKIPAFLAQKEAELEALLTPEELAQFKQAFADWAKKKNFKFMNFSAYQAQSQSQPKTNPAIDLEMKDYLREDIKQSMDNELLELRKQLRDQGINA